LYSDDYSRTCAITKLLTELVLKNMAAFWSKNKEKRSSESSQVMPLIDDVEEPSRENEGGSPPTLELQIPAASELESSINHRFGTVRIVLSAGTLIEGKLNFDGHVRIDGKLKGEVFSTNTMLVFPSGEVDAKIETAGLVVMGKVKGSVTATQLVEIHPGGNLQGHVTTPHLIVKEGGIFNGKCAMPLLCKTKP